MQEWRTVSMAVVRGTENEQHNVPNVPQEMNGRSQMHLELEKEWNVNEFFNNKWWMYREYLHGTSME